MNLYSQLRKHTHPKRDTTPKTSRGSMMSAVNFGTELEFLRRIDNRLKEMDFVKPPQFRG